MNADNNSGALTGTEEQRSSIELHSEGDIVFLVGPGEDRLRVHSLFIKAASPVFCAMFGSHFSEGRNLASNDIKEVTLPDDDYDALTVLFAIIHHRLDIIPQNLNVNQIYNISVLVDKYRCVEVVSFAGTKWLDRSPENALDAKLLTLAAAANFNDAAAFERVSRDMIFNSSPVGVQLTNNREKSGILSRILQKQAQLLRQIHQHLLAMFTYAQKCVPHSACDSVDRAATALVTKLRSLDLLLTATQTVAKMIEKLERIPDDLGYRGTLICQSKHPRPNYRQRTKPFIETIRQSGGLCLTCYKCGENCPVHHGVI